MRIKRLELKNFRGFKQAAVDFPEGNVVVFFGENGSGKTSVLDALAKLIRSLLRIPDLEDERVIFGIDFDVEDVAVGWKDARIEAKYNIGGSEQAGWISIQLNEKKGHVPANVTFGPYRQLFSEEHLSTQIEAANKSNESIPVLAYYKTNREIQRGKNHDQPSNDAISSRLDTYQGAFTASIDDFNSFEEWFRYQEDFENQEKINKQDLNYVNPYLDIVRRAVRNFIHPMSNLTGDLRVKRITYLNSAFTPRKEFSIVTTKNGQELHLSQLSSGERALVLLVADIARRAVIANPQMLDSLQSEGIVLIDEIELHLHPKWQRSVIPALRETFPNIQFIIATHSPQVLSNVPNGSVFEIENFQIVPRNTFGRDNRWILEAVMDDESRPKEVQDMLDRYFDFIRDGELERAATLRRELESLIGRDEPLFHKADILTSRKERSVAT